jgi:hypothetical protein
MQAENPDGWRALVSDLNLVNANHAVLKACRAAATQTKKEQLFNPPAQGMSSAPQNRCVNSQ